MDPRLDCPISNHCKEERYDDDDSKSSRNHDDGSYNAGQPTINRSTSFTILLFLSSPRKTHSLKNHRALICFIPRVLFATVFSFTGTTLP
jgi:hypothetical protein